MRRVISQVLCCRHGEGGRAGGWWDGDVLPAGATACLPLTVQRGLPWGPASRQGVPFPHGSAE